MGSQWGARVNIPVDWAACKALNKRALEIHSKVNPLTCQLVYNSTFDTSVRPSDGVQSLTRQLETRKRGFK